MNKLLKIRTELEHLKSLTAKNYELIESRNGWLDAENDAEFKRPWHLFAKLRNDLLSLDSDFFGEIREIPVPRPDFSNTFFPNGIYSYAHVRPLQNEVDRVIKYIRTFESSNLRASPNLSILQNQQRNNLELLRKVFLVHGHDEKILNQVARLLEHLDIEPIILFEKAGKGQTIIEKLEANSSVSFATVMLTPDDVGRSVKNGNEDLTARARQNVIFELGYFLGRLGRNNVAVLYDESVEIPSDYHGVEYIKIDAQGAWKLRLAKELKEAGLEVDMNKVQ